MAVCNVEYFAFFLIVIYATFSQRHAILLVFPATTSAVPTPARSSARSRPCACITSIRSKSSAVTRSRSSSASSASLSTASTTTPTCASTSTSATATTPTISTSAAADCSAGLLLFNVDFMVTNFDWLKIKRKVRILIQKIAVLKFNGSFIILQFQVLVSCLRLFLIQAA